jgi:hypothetical protein
VPYMPAAAQWAIATPSPVGVQECSQNRSGTSRSGLYTRAPPAGLRTARRKTRDRSRSQRLPDRIIRLYDCAASVLVRNSLFVSHRLTPPWSDSPRAAPGGPLLGLRRF